MKISVQYIYQSLMKLNIAWAFLSPIFLALVMMKFQFTSLFILKDLFFYMTFLLTFLLGRSKGMFIYGLYIILFLIYILTTTSLFFEINSWMIYSLRQLLAPILIFGFGYYLRINEHGLEKVVHYLYKISFWIIITGIFFLAINVWDIILLKNYFNAKGIPVDPNGLSYMFYEPAFSYIQRMVSTVLDPISLGHMLAAPLIMSYYGIFVKGKKRRKYLIVFTIGILLTISKGAILQVVLAVFFFNKKLSKLIRYLIPLLFVILVIILINIKGILIHLLGFKNAIAYLNLLGHGLGMVGNYAKMFSDDLSVYYRIHISDTFMGSVIGQLGLFGFMFWISFFITKTKDCFFGKPIRVGAILLTSQLIIAIISENTLNFSSFIIPGIISGILIRKKI